MEWEQLSLMPPEVVEIRFTLGIVREADHLQWQVSVTDPSVGKLLALSSAPHRPLAALEDELAIMVSDLTHWIERHVLPF